MPVHRCGVSAWSADEIGDDDEVAVQDEDAAAVPDRAVAVVGAVEVVECLVDAPAVQNR
jgi:hypothetical protein